MIKRLSIISLIFILFCSIGHATEPTPLTSFDELMTALKSGKKVRVVLYYGKCKLFSDGKEEEKSIDAIGGMEILTYEYFAEGVVHNKNAFVTFSASNLIQNPKGKGHVINYVKLRLSSDNKGKIIAQYLNPRNFKVKMDEYFLGDINNGIMLFSE